MPALKVELFGLELPLDDAFKELDTYITTIRLEISKALGTEVRVVYRDGFAFYEYGRRGS